MLLFCFCSLLAPIPPVPSSRSSLTLTVNVSVAHTYIPTLAACLCHSAHLVSLLWLSSAGPQDVKGRAKPVGTEASCRGASESSPSNPFFERRLEECGGAVENSEPLTSTVTHQAAQTLKPVMRPASTQRCRAAQLWLCSGSCLCTGSEKVT